MFKRNILMVSISTALAGASFCAQAADWVTTIDAGTYAGSTGTITFDDWGFSDQLNNRNATQFDAINGFGEVGQIQHVVTKDPDFITPDAPIDIDEEWPDAGQPLNTYINANMDAAVNFYLWGYTTGAGSTFSNMKIDKDGDYFIAQEDMTFQIYNAFDYQQVGTASLPGDADYNADGTHPTRIAFQPYVLSDAKGWCGSVVASNPGALEAMAGQVSFDFAFDVYFQVSPGLYSYSSTEIVRDFEMRSYGDLTVNVLTGGGDLQSYSARAVVNNTDPGINNAQVNGAPVDSNYYNQVSFMGGGVLADIDYCGKVSPGWVGGFGSDTSTYKFSSIIDGPVDAASCTTAGGEWQAHSYPGFSYILRADGIRVIEAMDYAAYPDLSNVPNVISGTAYNDDENAVSQPIADISGTANAFVFTDQSGVTLNTSTISNFVSITGLTRDTVISITGGEYSINGSAYTSARGTVVDGDIVELRITSSDTIDTTVSAILTIGSMSDTFSVSTSSSVIDTDADGVIDVLDNCPNVANTNQHDTDNDLYGNACDADFNNDGLVNSLDLGTFKTAFFASGNVETDLNDDGFVNSLDLGLMKIKFFIAPGPSGLIP